MPKMALRTMMTRMMRRDGDPQVCGVCGGMNLDKRSKMHRKSLEKNQHAQWRNKVFGEIGWARPGLRRQIYRQIPRQRYLSPLFPSGSMSTYPHLSHNHHYLCHQG